VKSAAPSPRASSA